jgi:hypothetical protein
MRFINILFTILNLLGFEASSFYIFRNTSVSKYKYPPNLGSLFFWWDWDLNSGP